MKRWLVLVGIVVTGSVVGVWLDPTCVVLGFLRGETFFEGRPTTYWHRALRSLDPKVQAVALRDLQDGGAAAVPVLIELVQLPSGTDWADVEVRCQAADLLGRLGAEARAAVPALMDALAGPDAHVRAVVAAALTTIGGLPAESIPRWIDLLESDARLHATRALSQFGAQAKSAVIPLQNLLKDKDPDVRWNAARTLGKIGPEAKDAVPALIATLQDGEAKVREHAAESLGQIGPEAKDAVPALIQVLGDA